jgi:hypothetical protein
LQQQPLAKSEKERIGVFWLSVSISDNWEDLLNRSSFQFSLLGNNLLLEWRREIQSGVSLFEKTVVVRELPENFCD